MFPDICWVQRAEQVQQLKEILRAYDGSTICSVDHESITVESTRSTASGSWKLERRTDIFIMLKSKQRAGFATLKAFT